MTCTYEEWKGAIEMGLFGKKKPSRSEVRGFARGRRSSAKAAEAHAQQQQRKAAFVARKREAKKTEGK